MTQAGAFISVNGVGSFPSARVKSIEITGGPANNWIDTRTVRVPESIHGGLGNDTIFGGQVLDRIFGDAGTDFVDAGSRFDFVNGDVEWNAWRPVVAGYSWLDVKQGGDIDCSAVATISDLILHGWRPTIENQGYGVFVVHLGLVRETVTFRGDTTILDWQPSDPGEFWTILVGRAWRQHTRDNPVWPDTVIHEIFGTQPATIWGNGGASFANVLQANQGRVIVFSTHNNPVGGLVDWHAYTFVRIVGNLVTVRNPWGWPNNGLVTVTVSELQRSIDQSMFFSNA